MQGNANGQPPPGIPGIPNGSGLPGQPGIPPLPAGPGQNGVPGQQPGYPGQSGIPGQPGYPGTPNNSQQSSQPSCYIGSCTPTTPSGQPSNGQQAQGGFPGMPGQQGNPANGTMPGGVPVLPGGAAQPGGQTAAGGIIQGLLTTPRPGGMPTTMPGTTVGGGIAGVASKYEAEGIMVINDRTAINEWEYIFDLTKYRVPPNPVSGTVGTPQPQNPGTSPTQGINPPAPGSIFSPSPSGH